METRFAGSQHLDERRRRRLAAESGADCRDSNEPSDTKYFLDPADVVSEAPNSEGHTFQTNGAANTDSPFAIWIPRKAWKHCAAGVLGLLLGWGILSAGSIGFQSAAVNVGPATSRLIATDGGLLLGWCSSTLLFLSAQAAWMIWRVRSRSLNDFAGRYRVWTKVAAAWLFFSLCVSTGAHHVWSELFIRFLPNNHWQTHNLCWLIPAVAVGAWLISALHREMRACRVSLLALVSAAVAFLLSAAALLELPGVSGPFDAAAVLWGSAWTGNVLLLLSMTLHARHVIFEDGEPPAEPSRRLRIPRPHFRLRSPNRKLPAEQDAAASASEENWIPEQPEPQGKKSRKEPETKPLDAIEQADPPQAKPRKPQIRLDAGHAISSAPPAVATSESRISTTESEPAPRAEPRNAPAKTHEIQESRSDAPRPPAQPAFTPDSPSNSDDENMDTDADPMDSAENGDAFSTGNSELKGLSKKQRRRLMQEQRERERTSRRKQTDEQSF